MAGMHARNYNFIPKYDRLTKGLMGRTRMDVSAGLMNRTNGPEVARGPQFAHPCLNSQDYDNWALCLFFLFWGFQKRPDITATFKCCSLSSSSASQAIFMLPPCLSMCISMFFSGVIHSSPTQFRFIFISFWAMNTCGQIDLSRKV